MAFSDESGNSMVMPVSPLYGNGGNGYGSFGKLIEMCEEEKYSMDGGMSRRSYDGGMSRRRGYSNDGYYYDDGNSYRRGRAANGRFVSRDGSEMARKLREMMADAPDENSRQEIQRLAEKMEQM